MRLWLFSDMHFEFEHARPTLPEIPPADVCVCAGDLLNGVANSVEWLAAHVAPWMPVVFVPGNHEYYGDSIMEGLEWGRAAAGRHPDVHLLDNDSIVIDGVRFLGATLWTDYALDGGTDQDIAWAMANAEGRLNDHRQIAWRRLPAYEGFPASTARTLHQRSRHWLKRQLQQSFAGPTVVVTHHAPHPLSVGSQFKGSALNPAFASDLGEVMELWRPQLWVHGHMHDSSDYRVRDTRVVANPKGYDGENGRFDPALVVEV
jgi:Icc-related predicted phosphoesterase